MLKKIANTFLIFSLMVIAVLSWHWLDHDTATSDVSDPVLMSQNETDYYLEDFKITNVNNDKGQVYELSGKSLSHYFENGNSTIEQPNVRVLSNDNDYWIGDAQSGELSADFSVLVLTGDVDLAHHRNNAMPPITAQTQSVTIDTVKRLITSDQAVQIATEEWSFNANQMRADIDNGKLLFQSGVEANYAVPK